MLDSFSCIRRNSSTRKTTIVGANLWLRAILRLKLSTISKIPFSPARGAEHSTST